jgi:hypothetical protein
LKPKLFLALPVYGAMDPWFCQSLLRLMERPPVQVQVAMLVGDSLVSRARNTLTAQFLESDCTHMLFADSDLIFGPDHVARLMSHREPVVGGMYPKKQEGPLAWVLNACDPCPAPQENGLQEVRYVGTGFLRVAREVFERMIFAGSVTAYRPDHKDQIEYDFWSVGVYKFPGFNRYLSEDWFFCQRVLDLGVKVYADTGVILKHSGGAIYPLQSQEAESGLAKGFIAGAAALPQPACDGAGGSSPPPQAPAPQFEGRS